VTIASKVYLTNTANVFGDTTAKTAPADSGFDFFLNPNLWGINAAAGTKCLISNAPNPTAAQEPNAAAGAGDGTIHCYGIQNVTTGTTWTRVRNLWVTAYTDATATKTITTAAPLYWTYFWEGFVTLQNFSGACIKADVNVADYYGVFYAIGSSATAVTTAGTITTTPTSDLGELGSANLLSGGSDGFITKVFFSAPIFTPGTSTSTVFTGGYAAALTGTPPTSKAWITSYGDAAVNSNNGLTFIRVRWTPAAADPMAPNGKIAIFWKVM
jgi:hypothetical protein